MATKKIIQVDVTSDTVCPWCYVGKKYLEKAIDETKDRYQFEVRWHPFFLNPDAPAEGINKREYIRQKFGESQIKPLFDHVNKVFADLGLAYSLDGLTGKTLDSHRLIYLAGQQGYEKQNALVDELFANYFSQDKYIGDRKVLVAAADKVGVHGAQEFLDDPHAGLKEVTDEVKKFSRGVSGVPHFLINGRYQLSGAQQPQAFIEVFQRA
eukprot:TRINITY_DN12619_c0_g1_i1.p1 TRINITY_DN12619_c0_g1~~TRINITY_DN12619_c0_g1_i1.p1  ORF type:complete len:210 (+),score=33.57 TRINITY_DN12619_c0_g1_i1:208-837(+)